MPMATRRDLFDPSDPEQLQPEQRLTEVAAILAAGMLRIRQRRQVTMPNVRLGRNRGPALAPPRGRAPQLPWESGENSLQLSRSISTVRFARGKRTPRFRRSSGLW